MENISDILEVMPKMYEWPGERTPVALYEQYTIKRPTCMRYTNVPIHIATHTISLTKAKGKPWFIRKRFRGEVGVYYNENNESGNWFRCRLTLDKP